MCQILISKLILFSAIMYGEIIIRSFITSLRQTGMFRSRAIDGDGM
jgi:hypothetical protein